MAIVFIGTHTVSIDEKGRLSVPARFRAQLLNEAEGKLVISQTPEGIKLYPLPEFERVTREEIGGIADVKLRKMVMLRFVGGSVSVEMDAQGRFVVPSEMRASLAGNTLLIGQEKRFLLVTVSQWAALQADSEAEYTAQMAHLDL